MRNILILCLLFASSAYGSSSRDFVEANSDIIVMADDRSASTGLTVCGYIRPNRAANKNEGYFHKKFSASDPWITWNLRSSDTTYWKPQFQMAISGTNRFTVNSSSGAIDQWWHMCGRWESGSKMELYWNTENINQSGAAYTGTISHDAFNFRVGHNEVDNEYVDAQMAHMTHYSRQLSVAEIKEHYYKPEVVKGSCFGYYTLFGTDVTTERDLSGSGNNGTITGTEVSTFAPPDIFFYGSAQ